MVNAHGEMKRVNRKISIDILCILRLVNLLTYILKYFMKKLIISDVDCLDIADPLSLSSFPIYPSKDTGIGG